MKNILLLICFVLGLFRIEAQPIPPIYFDLVARADSLYKVQAFKQAALTFTEAFKTNNGKGLIDHRYNAACCWALAGGPDSAFMHLYKIANLAKFSSLNLTVNDQDLNSLHGDARWQPLIDKIKQNLDEVELKLNKPLIARLDSIYSDDQTYRSQIGDIEKKYGRDSKEMKANWDIIREKDSLNLLKVKSILDQYGWLGGDMIGGQGNITLFLVIQHADLATQEKYLPLLKEAVKNGKADGSDLALLEDRVALRQGKRQIYGSQIGRDPDTKLYYVSPLEDPDHVDERRAQVGLQPLADYVNRWNIKWDVGQYKIDLPKLEEKLMKK